MNRAGIALLIWTTAATAQAADWGLIHVPVASLHESDAFTAEVVSQAVMGTPVRLLTDSDWKRIETPDGYVGWVHRNQVTPLSATQLGVWNAAVKIVITATEAAVTDKAGAPISLLPVGTHVRLLHRETDRLQIALPDGRTGFIAPTDGEILTRFQSNRQQARRDPETAVQDMITNAKRLLGRSYLWGGTSSFAMDCSGFVQTVWRMSDFIIPRDAGQQARCGHPWQLSDGTVPDLKPGDLLFFGTADNPPKISHVGLSLGGARFIHSLGDVRTASLNPPDSDYDAREAARYIGARTLPFDDACVQTTAEHNFYQNPPIYRFGL